MIRQLVLHLVTLIRHGEECALWRSSFCSFRFFPFPFWTDLRSFRSVLEMNCVGMEKFSRWSPGRLDAGAKVGIMLAFNFPRCEHFLWPGWGDLSDSEIVVRDTYGHRWTCGLFNYLRYETLRPCNFLRSELTMNSPPHLYETRMYVAIFIRTHLRTVSWASWIQSIPISWGTSQ
jgi:hypothetical protein